MDDCGRPILQTSLGKNHQFAIIQQISYLMDSAKSRGFEALGENKEAKEIAVRHLQA
jgi:hypothetical protein